MISWIGLWIFVFAAGGLVATLADIENIHQNKGVIFFFIALSLASGLAVIFR